MMIDRKAFLITAKRKNEQISHWSVYYHFSHHQALTSQLCAFSKLCEFDQLALGQHREIWPKPLILRRDPCSVVGDKNS